ncbi:MAG: SLBB domain-containing protein [Thermomicrobiales bacterium]
MQRSDLDGQNRFVVAVAAMIAVAIAVVFATQQTDKSNTPKHAIGDGADAAAATIVVDIDGAVGTPGVYALPGDARVQNAIAAAGGLTTKADV